MDVATPAKSQKKGRNQASAAKKPVARKLKFTPSKDNTETPQVRHYKYSTQKSLYISCRNHYLIYTFAEIML